MTTPPPGWYDDGRGERRWWDGAAWTDHVATPLPEHATDPAVAAAAPLSAEDDVRDGPAPPHTFSESRAADAYSAYGAEPTSPERRKSSMWVVWIALGIIAIGVVVVLALLTPALIAGLTAQNSPAVSSSSSASSAPSSSPPKAEQTAEPVDGSPSAADRQAATDTVIQHTSSWLTGDCEDYLATTTEQFRSAVMLVPDCESFDTESRLFAGQVDGYEVLIGEVEVVGSAVVVSTTETYTSAYDREGNATDEPMAYEDRYEYILVSSDAGWVIDDFFAE